MKDMGLADMILGVKISRTYDELVLSQTHYIDKILEKYNKSDVVVAKTHVDLSLRLSRNSGEGVSQLEYS